MEQKGTFYYVVVYDAKIKRVTKILKTLRKYLHWVQNSVFEGTLSTRQFEQLKQELRQIIDMQNDSIIIYRMREQWMERQVLGIEKGNTFWII